MMKLSLKAMAFWVLFFQLGHSESATLSENPDYGLRKTSWPSGCDNGVGDAPRMMDDSHGHGEEGSRSLFSHKTEIPTRKKLGRRYMSPAPPSPQMNSHTHFASPPPRPPPPRPPPPPMMTKIPTRKLVRRYESPPPPSPQKNSHPGYWRFVVPAPPPPPT